MQQEDITELLVKINEMCERIWRAEEVSMREIGEFVQSAHPFFLKVVTILNEEPENWEIRDIFLNGINNITEGLQYKDKMLLADVLYYEIGSILALFVENGV